MFMRGDVLHPESHSTSDKSSKAAVHAVRTEYPLQIYQNMRNEVHNWAEKDVSRNGSVPEAMYFIVDMVPVYTDPTEATIKAHATVVP